MFSAPHIQLKMASVGNPSMVTDRKSSWLRRWADFKLYCLLNSREGAIHSKKARVVLPNGCFPTTSTPKRGISETMGTHSVLTSLYSKLLNLKNQLLTIIFSPGDARLRSCKVLPKCNQQKVLNSHTHIHTGTHELTQIQSTHTLTEIHIFLAIPCRILTSNSAFNSESRWVGISVSWLDPTLIQSSR